MIDCVRPGWRDGPTRADYLDDLVGRKIAVPDDALLSRLVTERLDTGELTRSEVAGMGLLLLFAGHETTSNMIALGTAALLQQPDQLALLRGTDDPKGASASRWPASSCGSSSKPCCGGCRHCGWRSRSMMFSSRGTPP